MANTSNTHAIPDALKILWISNGFPEDFLSHLKLTGNPDTAVPSSFRLGLAAQIAVALSGLSAAYLYYLRTSKAQDVNVDARHAALSFRSEAWYTVDSQLPVGGVWDSIAGLYKTKDDNYVRIHTNFPHHRAGVLSVLSISDEGPLLERSIVADAILLWDSKEFEHECAARGLCVTALRSYAEWDREDQKKALEGLPPVVVKKVGDAPRRGCPNETERGKEKEKAKQIRPLDGMKVLDLSRVLAGPIAGKTLAAHGADVLLLTSPSLPSLPLLDVETSLGKRTAQLDLTKENDINKLRELVKEADVFLQAYRPAGLEEKSFGVQDVVSLRPGIVYAGLRAWGWDGPWAARKGTATGFNVDEGEAYQAFINSDRPRSFPMQALDHAAAHFLAFGINACLCKTIMEGGSWEVRVSLASVGQWVRSLGRLSPQQAFNESTPFPERRAPPGKEIWDLGVEWQQSKGPNRHDTEGQRPKRMRTVRHAAMLSATPVREGETALAPMGLDSYVAGWL
ncbi:CoA-transferase family III [Phlegmacium glaucopus]|nr:CoA-transferase family III [Phlegmacium glaucopus]